MLRRFQVWRGRRGEASAADPVDGRPLAALHHFDEPSLPVQPGGVAVPNKILRSWAGTTDLALFLGIGEAWAQLASRYLPAEPRVLDLGCGCGKLARFLHLNPRLSYVGIDLFLPAILWCRRAFAAAGERFRFEHFDGVSATYNPTGKIPTGEYVLPVAAASIDLVVCGSLFTHLFEPEARHYLAELRRVMAPGGGALVSLHVEPAAGSLYSGDEGRIDVDEAHFLGMADAAGLRSAERVGVVFGQVVHLFRAA